MRRDRPTIPREEYASRRDTIRADARAAGLDGILAWAAGGATLDRYANVFYLTNHYWPYTLLTDNPPDWRRTASSYFVMPVDGPAILVVDQPDWRTDLVDVDEVVFRRDHYAGELTPMPEVVRDSVKGVSGWRTRSACL